MTDDNQEEDMPKGSAVTKLEPTPNWLGDVLAKADAQIADVPDDLSAGIAAEVKAEAEANRSPESNGFTYEGHTDSEYAFVHGRIAALETAIDDYNREITAASGNAAALINLIEANRDDLVDRFSAKRENAIRSIESLKAQMRVLGQ